MNKEFAVMMIVGFLIPTIWMTIVSIEGTVKSLFRNKVCQTAVCGVTLLMWCCIIGLAWIIWKY